MGVWTGDSKVHELYTVACGLYACWVVLRTAMILYTWIPQGWRAIFNKIAEWTILVCISVPLLISYVNSSKYNLHSFVHWFIYLTFIY